MKIFYESSYKSWSGLKQRCDNPNNPDYPNYGGRGITYDPRWAKFSNFYADMGDRPDGLTIDRIDNNKGYYKENCRWVDRTVQNNNRRERSLMTEARPNNKSTRVLGISWEVREGRQLRVVSYFDQKKKRTILYRGPDFFEACCARKSWESRNQP